MENNMNSMETATAPKLNPAEQALYLKCMTLNPGISIEDFLELRSLALKSKNAGVHKFFEIAGVVMDEQPNKETIEETRAHLN